MAIQEIQTTDTLNEGRIKINSNFDEVDTNKMDSATYDPAGGEKQVAFDDEVVKLDQTTPQTITGGQPIQNTLTASEIVATDGDKKLSSLPVATYPNLTELAYVKGVTSGIQSQLNGKQDSLGFTAENVVNKKTSMTGNTASDTFFLTAKAIYDWGTGLFQTLSNLVTSRGGTPSDTKYPSEKLVKDNLDTKLNLSGGTMTGKTVPAGTAEIAKTYTPATGSQTVTIDCNVNNQHIVTGHADGTAITFAVSNVTNNQIFSITINQGAVPSTIAGWFSTIKRPGGTAPTLTATANKSDTFIFMKTGTNTYNGFVAGQNLQNL